MLLLLLLACVYSEERMGSVVSNADNNDDFVTNLCKTKHIISPEVIPCIVLYHLYGSVECVFLLTPCFSG